MTPVTPDKDALAAAKIIIREIQIGLKFDDPPPEMIPEVARIITATYKPRLDRADALLISQKGRTAAAESMENHAKGARDNLRKAYLALEAENDDRKDAFNALQAVVDKLDRTADNVPITPGMPLWCAFRRCVVKGKAVGGDGVRVRVEYDEPIDLTDGGGAMADESDPALRVCFSTLELAQEAFKKATP